ncbi:ABC-type transport auxiliary lipoprotein family protein [Phenylobacterium sp.]|jgi:cholesterol transport system auxiliary component|uniref:ABC-type transport auxiliary lipoprotein family protein n=1 Tax=Phenylobacterium sp. TaxID=1871053 RepID=UPI002F416128
MSVRNRLFRVLGAVVCAAALSGCISLLPKSKPAQLYRFAGAAPEIAAPAASNAPPFAVQKGFGSFDRASAGDRMLTLQGDKAAYISDARWVAPAMVLFDEALMRAFDGNPGPARLLGRGQRAAQAPYQLRLDVRDFAAVYAEGPKAAPTVVVRVRAGLVRVDDQSAVGDRMFEAKVRAGDNRVSAIAAAYDQAVGDVLGQLVAWVNAPGVAAAPAAPPQG